MRCNKRCLLAASSNIAEDIDNSRLFSSHLESLNNSSMMSCANGCFTSGSVKMPLCVFLFIFKHSFIFYSVADV